MGIEGCLARPVRWNELYKTMKSVSGFGPDMDSDEERGPGMSFNDNGSSDDISARDAIKKGRILLAEDYPTNQQIAIKNLSKAGYSVDLAKNGREAVEAYKRQHYDLILMDVQMPLVDGYEAVRRIRDLEFEMQDKREAAHVYNPGRIPIIAMTAHAIKGCKAMCMDAGMDDYIAKPLKRKALLDMVQKWIQPDEECGIRDVKLVPVPCVLSPESEDASPMNFEKALAEFEGDTEFLAEVLDGFVRNIRGQIETIRQAISLGDAELVSREAHSIKGGSANLTADSLSKTASDLEHIGKSGELGQAVDILERLEKKFYRLEAYIKENKYHTI